MQLKRDTDYAFRIAFYLAHRSDRELPGATLSEISRNAGIPRRSAERICAELTAGGILRKEAAAEELFYKGEIWEEATLLDLIRTIEGNVNLFAVFGRKSKAFRENRRMLQALDETVQGTLAKLKIREL